MGAPISTQDVLVPPESSAIFLVATVRAGVEADAREAIADVPGVIRAVAFRRPEARLTCVVGIGAHLWDRMYDAPRPRHLHPFEPIAGSVHTAVATPGDLLFHIRAHRPDLCFELATQIAARFDGLIDVVSEVHGFKFFDQRDLLGFVDGTENPSGVDAEAAVIVGEEDPAYAGSSYVIVQKYLHDLDAWNKLAVEQQELTIGRRKLDDIELPDSVKPSNSHVVLNTIVDEDGAERQIVRENMPFGEVGASEFGTFFIGYAADPGVTEEMLRNMFIGKPPGNHDRILDFSTAVTGSLFFVPTTTFLEDGPPAAKVPDSAETTTTEPTPDGSLGIGSLRRSGSP